MHKSLMNTRYYILLHGGNKRVNDTPLDYFTSSQKSEKTKIYKILQTAVQSLVMPRNLVPAFREIEENFQLWSRHDGKSRPRVAVYSTTPFPRMYRLWTPPYVFSRARLEYSFASSVASEARNHLIGQAHTFELTNHILAHFG